MPQDLQSLVLIGLVSSGKSTLANALIGIPFLPTSNLSCTTMAVTVVDPASIGKFPDAIYVDQGKYVVLSGKDIPQVVEQKNNSGDGGELFLRMPLSKLNHGRFPVALVDTPGTNDSTASDYNKIASLYLSKVKSSIVLFVSHVRTCGNTDEENCLRDIAQVMRESGLRQWFAAINGWDLTDPETDKKERYIEKMELMAKKCDLPKPQTYCVASLPAELSYKVMRGWTLTGSESNHLTAYLRSVKLSARVQDNRRRIGRIGNKTLRTAIYHTGITTLTKALYRYFQESQSTQKGMNRK